MILACAPPELSGYGKTEVVIKIFFFDISSLDFRQI